MEIRSELEIAAPATDIWGILTDFPRYPEWNPFITEMESEGVVGGPLRVSLSLPEGRDHRLKSTLLRMEEDYELRFRAHLLFPGLFDGEHFMRLVALDPQRTRFVQGDNFTGVLLRFSGRTLTQLARGCDYMNEALKRRAEANRRPIKTDRSEPGSAGLSARHNRVG